jgi:hypothetical protein
MVVRAMQPFEYMLTVKVNVLPPVASSMRAIPIANATSLEVIILDTSIIAGKRHTIM